MDRLADAVLRGPIGDDPPGARRLPTISRIPTEPVGFRSWPTFRDLLAAAKAEITEVDTAGAAERIADGCASCSTCASPTSTTRARSPAPSTSPAATSRRRSRAGSPTRRAGRRVLRRRRAHRRSPPRRCRSSATPTSCRWPAASAGGRTRAGRGRRRSTLTADQRNRYQRHLLLPEVGVAGQAKLLESKVLLLGAGGLGSPAALYLAAAGVGTIGIVDMDEVDASNLQRQILHNLDRIGDRKVDSAKKTLTLLNPDVDVVTYDTRLDADNIIDIIAGYDVIVDGADNFPTRYLLNDASVKLGIPVVHGSIFRFEGMVSVFHPLAGPDLPRHGARAAARRAGAELRRGRRARRAARHRRLDPGARGDQDAARPRRAADRPDPDDRHDGDGVPHVQAQARPGERGHLREPRPDPDPRARRPLRRPRSTITLLD